MREQEDCRMNLLGPKMNVKLWSVILCGRVVVWITVMAYEWTYKKEKGKIQDTFLFNATVMEEMSQLEPVSDASCQEAEYH